MDHNGNPPGSEPAGISLSDEEAVKGVVANSIFALWDVVNSLTRLKPSRRERYRVTFFGSARARAGTFAYEETRRVAGHVAGAHPRARLEDYRREARLRQVDRGHRAPGPAPHDDGVGADLEPVADVLDVVDHSRTARIGTWNGSSGLAQILK